MSRYLVLLLAMSAVPACAVGVGGPSDPAGDGGASTSPGADSSPSQCSGWAGPSTASGCRACSSGQSCQANGCYGGYWCDTSTMKCHPTPSGC